MRKLLAGILLLGSTMGAQELGEEGDMIRRRAEHFHGPRLLEKPGAAADARLKAVRQMKTMAPVGPGATSTWKLLGPRPTVIRSDTTSAGPPIASGRVTSIAVHPVNPNIVYIGAANGGVWKTQDGGRNWVPLTDDQDTLAIGSLALDPQHPDTIYAGTGEENFSPDNYFGAGILKTEDGGVTWKLIASKSFGGPTSATSGGAFIGAMVVNPKDGRILLAAVKGSADERSGIYRSMDAGLSWKLVLKGAPGSSVVFDPANPNIAYAGLGGMDESEANGIYKSLDGGITWKPAGDGIPKKGVGRVTLTIAASKPDVLYTAIANPESDEPLGVFKTIDGAGTWKSANAPSYCFATCWYANSIQVSPANPNVVLVGGLVLYMTRDGGETWVAISEGANQNFIHWDIHALVFSAPGNRVYVGTDGGMYRAENIGIAPVRDVGWNNINDTLAITQFYQGCSDHPGTTDFILCGTQDNGTQIYTGGTTWNMISGADGGFTAVDPARPSVYYYSVAAELDLEKTSPFTRFKGTLGIAAGSPNLKVDDCFLQPLTLDPANPERLYYACRQLFRSDDGGGAWLAVSDVLPGRVSGAKGTPAAYTYISVSPLMSDRVYAAANDGQVYVSSNATAKTGVQWVHGKGLPGRVVSCVVADAFRADTAYATVLGFSGFGDSMGHIFKTTDAGVSWVDISGNLPNIPVNTLAVDQTAPDVVFVGTDIGVFGTSNRGASWSPIGRGLPRSPVVDLKLHPGGHVIRAATHGRGMWELQVPVQLRQPRTVRLDSAGLTVGPAALLPQPKTVVKGAGFTAGDRIRWNGSERATRLVDAGTLEADLTIADLTAPGRTSVSVRPPGTAGSSNTVNVETGGTPAIQGMGNGAGVVPVQPEQTISFAPGTIVSLYGASLAPDKVASQPESPAQTLDGAIVEFRSVAVHTSYIAPLFYVSPTQINFQVPWDVPLGVTLTLDVVQGTRMSELFNVNIARYSPGLFSVNSSGSGQGWILCPDGKLAAPEAAGAHPAKPGDLIHILTTGLGTYWQDGSKPTDTITVPEVTIGGVPAKVTESRAVSPFVGIYRVVAKVPEGGNAPSGSAIPVILTAGGVQSNTVTMAIQ